LQMVYVIQGETSLPSPPLTFTMGQIFLTLLQVVYVIVPWWDIPSFSPSYLYNGADIFNPVADGLCNIQDETSLPSPPLTFIKGQIFLTLLQMVYVIYKMRHPFLLLLLPL
jgi:hypothetical protein